MNIEEKKADFIRRFKASRERKAEYIAQWKSVIKLTEKSLKLYTEISKNCPLKLWKDRLVAVWGEETR